MIRLATKIKKGGIVAVKQDSGTVALILLIIFVTGLLIGIYAVGPHPGEAADDSEIRDGVYQIVTVVELTEDYALVVLKQEGKEPRYYRIEKDKVLNFEDIPVATTLVKVRDDNFRYIELE